MVIHPIEPIYDKNSKIFILGSFPSVKSREESSFDKEQDCIMGCDTIL